MDIWDLASLTVEPQRAEVLHSDEGAARVIAISLRAAEELHQERHAIRATEDTLLLLLLAPWPGPGHPSLRG